MASYREEREVERKFVRQELLAGWIAIAASACALVLAVVLGVVAVTHASDWHVTAGAGSTSAGIFGALIWLRRRATRPPE